MSSDCNRIPDHNHIPNRSSHCSGARAGSRGVAVLWCLATSLTIEVGGASAERPVSNVALWLAALSGGVGVRSDVQCGAGKYWNGFGCYSCAGGCVSAGGLGPYCCMCPIGSYCTSTDSSSVAGTVCPNNTISPLGSTVSSACNTLCPPGWWSINGTGFMPCMECTVGTWSNTSGAKSSSTCISCPAGHYCPFGSPYPVPCPAGTFCSGPASGYYSGCSIGSYCPTGSSSPFECPAGTWSPSNSLPCNICPAGTWSSAIRATSEATCVTCAAGYYCPEGSAAPNPCPAGTWSSALGAKSNSSCYQCPAGSFCPTGSVYPTICPTGTFCSKPGSSLYAPCPAGSYAPVTGRTSCLLCPPGSWVALNSSSFCDQFCAAGTFRAAFGGKSASDCVPCPIGSFSETDGASICTQCPAGTSSNVTASSSSFNCKKCSVGTGTYAAAGSSSCSVCPLGSYPDATQSSCLVGAYSCPSGFATRSRASPLSFSDCAALTCSPPLAFSGDRTSCVGCAANSSGDFPACSRCSNCPGLTATPLLSFPPPAEVSTACPPLTGPLRLTPALPAKPPLRSGFSWLTGVFNPDVVIVSGITSCLFSLALHAVAHAHPPLGGTVDIVLKRVDAFARSVTGPAPGAPHGTKPRRVGGTFSLLGGISFVTLALVLILQRAADNVSSQESVVALTDARLALARSLPIFSATPWGAGVQVRISASGDGDVCSRPIAWSPGGAGWVMTSTPCSAGVSQLVFSCSDCIGTLPSLTVSLHYSCQSLLVEAAALDGSGEVTSFALPAGETVASPGVLLSEISWTLPTLLSVVNSTVSASSSGYILTSGQHSITTQSLSASGSGLAVVPSTSLVLIKVSFPLNTFFALKVLTEKQSITLLISSIVGLAGIFGLFGTLLSVTDVVLSFLGRVLKQSSKLTGPETEIAQPETALAVTMNPLVRRTQSVWHKISEGAETWYESETGALSWRLPEGAVLAD